MFEIDGMCRPARSAAVAGFPAMPQGSSPQNMDDPLDEVRVRVVGAVSSQESLTTRIGTFLGRKVARQAQGAWDRDQPADEESAQSSAA